MMIAWKDGWMNQAVNTIRRTYSLNKSGRHNEFKSTMKTAE